jgi:hypothetical protein
MTTGKSTGVAELMNYKSLGYIVPFEPIFQRTMFFLAESSGRFQNFCDVKSVKSNGGHFGRHMNGPYPYQNRTASDFQNRYQPLVPITVAAA